MTTLMDPGQPQAGEQPTRSQQTLLSALASQLYVQIIAGIATGIVVVGVGSRLAMLVLRVSSADSVDGVTSDDGFTIGRFTLSGTYNLLLIGAGVGIIGTCAYQLVRPWLIGPGWFRRCTVGLASGAVVGSMLVKTNGIDFVALTPTWLAIGLFVALPAAFAVCLAIAVDRVEQRVTVRTRGRRDWIIAIALAAAFTPTLIIFVFTTAAFVVWATVRDLPVVRSVASATTTALVARALWLGVAVVGLVALVRDVVTLY